MAMVVMVIMVTFVVVMVRTLVRMPMGHPTVTVQVAPQRLIQSLSGHPAQQSS